MKLNHFFQCALLLIFSITAGADDKKKKPDAFFYSDDTIRRIQGQILQFSPKSMQAINDLKNSNAEIATFLSQKNNLDKNQCAIRAQEVLKKTDEIMKNFIDPVSAIYMGWVGGLNESDKKSRADWLSKRFFIINKKEQSIEKDGLLHIATWADSKGITLGDIENALAVRAEIEKLRIELEGRVRDITHFLQENEMPAVCATDTGADPLADVAARDQLFKSMQSLVQGFEKPLEDRLQKPDETKKLLEQIKIVNQNLADGKITKEQAVAQSEVIISQVQRNTNDVVSMINWLNTKATQEYGAARVSILKDLVKANLGDTSITACNELIKTAAVNVLNIFGTINVKDMNSLMTKRNQIDDCRNNFQAVENLLKPYYAETPDSQYLRSKFNRPYETKTPELLAKELSSELKTIRDLIERSIEEPGNSVRIEESLQQIINSKREKNSRIEEPMFMLAWVDTSFARATVSPSDRRIIKKALQEEIIKTLTRDSSCHATLLPFGMHIASFRKEDNPDLAKFFRTISPFFEGRNARVLDIDPECIQKLTNNISLMVGELVNLTPEQMFLQNYASAYSSALSNQELLKINYYEQLINSAPVKHTDIKSKFITECFSQSSGIFKDKGINFNYEGIKASCERIANDGTAYENYAQKEPLRALQRTQLEDIAGKTIFIEIDRTDGSFTRLVNKEALANINWQEAWKKHSKNPTYLAAWKRPPVDLRKSREDFINFHKSSQKSMEEINDLLNKITKGMPLVEEMHDIQNQAEKDSAFNEAMAAAQRYGMALQSKDCQATNVFKMVYVTKKEKWTSNTPQCVKDAAKAYEEANLAFEKMRFYKVESNLIDLLKKSLLGASKKYEEGNFAEGINQTDALYNVCHGIALWERMPGSAGIHEDINWKVVASILLTGGAGAAARFVGGVLKLSPLLIDAFEASVTNGVMHNLKFIAGLTAGHSVLETGVLAYHGRDLGYIVGAGLIRGVGGVSTLADPKLNSINIGTSLLPFGGLSSAAASIYFAHDTAVAAEEGFKRVEYATTSEEKALARLDAYSSVGLLGQMSVTHGLRTLGHVGKRTPKLETSAFRMRNKVTGKYEFYENILDVNNGRPINQKQITEVEYQNFLMAKGRTGRIAHSLGEAGESLGRKVRASAENAALGTAIAAHALMPINPSAFKMHETTDSNKRVVAEENVEVKTESNKSSPKLNANAQAQAETAWRKNMRLYESLKALENASIEGKQKINDAILRLEKKLQSENSTPASIEAEIRKRTKFAVNACKPKDKKSSADCLTGTCLPAGN